MRNMPNVEKRKYTQINLGDYTAAEDSSITYPNTMGVECPKMCFLSDWEVGGRGISFCIHITLFFPTGSLRNAVVIMQ
jgi:hypothetical protein